jgi:hypothetical protein
MYRKKVKTRKRNNFLENNKIMKPVSMVSQKIPKQNIQTQNIPKQNNPVQNISRQNTQREKIKKDNREIIDIYHIDFAGHKLPPPSINTINQIDNNKFMQPVRLPSPKRSIIHNRNNIIDRKLYSIKI